MEGVEQKFSKRVVPVRVDSTKELGYLRLELVTRRHHGAGAWEAGRADLLLKLLADRLQKENCMLRQLCITSDGSEAHRVAVDGPYLQSQYSLQTEL